MKGSKKFWLIAVVFAAIAAFLFYRFMNDLQTRYEPNNLKTVVVAVNPIAQHTIVSPEDVELQKIPAQYVNPTALTDKNRVVGQITVNDIAKGEQILRDRLLNDNNRKGQMAYVVPAGKRAISIAVDQISGVSGYIKPDDRVDIIATTDIPVAGPNGQESDRTYSVLALQDILVLAVGDSLEIVPDSTVTKKKDPVETKTITLAVLPHEGQLLALAAERGSVRLMLRPPAEKGIKALPAMDLKALLKAGAPAAAEK